MEACHFPVVAGLDILLGTPDDSAGAPSAMVLVRGWDRTERALDAPCLIKVWVSPSRLRAMLSDVSIADSLLVRPPCEGGVRIELHNSAMVRRIAEDIRHNRHDGGARALFLQSKVIELLLEGISMPSQDDHERMAFSVRDILLSDPRHPPSLAELSHRIGADARKVNDHFRAVFGMTVFKWLVDWRLTRARDLVLGGDLTISEISHSLGYAHLPTFVNAFTRRFGTSPGRLRGERSNPAIVPARRASSIGESL